MGDRFDWTSPARAGRKGEGKGAMACGGGDWRTRPGLVETRRFTEAVLDCCPFHTAPHPRHADWRTYGEH